MLNSVVNATSYDDQHIMMYAMHVLESISLKIKKFAEGGQQGYIGFVEQLECCSVWEPGMQMCISSFLLHEITKEEGVIQLKWMSSEGHCSDHYNKTLGFSFWEAWHSFV